jgi:protein-S-isoprenylcysteine O-methyltransferase Ste14
VVSLAIKSRAEEARMRATFPEYERYLRESWAIIPGLY